MSHSHHRLKQFATLRVLKGYVMESGSRYELHVSSTLCQPPHHASHPVAN